MKTEATLGIACVMKNEAPYIIEWLAHHRLLGIRNFFIANNDSTDETTALLDALQQAELLVHHPFPTQEGEKPHVPAFQMLFDKHKDDVEWMAMIDADEFLTPSSEHFNICHFLHTFSRQYPTAGAIAINWATYGSSGHRFFSPHPLAQRFTMHAEIENPVNQHYKSIIKTSSTHKVLTPHHVALDSNSHYRHADGTQLTHSNDHSVPLILRECRSQHICWKPLRLNHYVIKSYQEFIQRKSRRGRAFTGNSLNNEFFLYHDNNIDSTKPSQIYLHNLLEEISIIEHRIGFTGFDTEKYIYSSSNPQHETWAIPQAGSIDSIEFLSEGRIQVAGWTLPWKIESAKSIEFRINDGDWMAPLSFTSTIRHDVLAHYPSAPQNCGFTACFESSYQIGDIEKLDIRAIANDWLATEPIIQNPKVAKILAQQKNQT